MRHKMTPDACAAPAKPLGNPSVAAHRRHRTPAHPHPMADTRFSRWQTFLSHASRSRSFLWKFALGALLTGGLIGAALSYLRPPAAHLFGERVLALAGLSEMRDDTKWMPPERSVLELVESFTAEVANPAVTFGDVIRAIPDLAPHIAVTNFPTITEAMNQRFTPPEAQLATHYLAASNLKDAAAIQSLRAFAAQPEAPRYANYALGRIESRLGDHRAAFVAFQKEGLREDAYESRNRAVWALVDAKDFDSLATLRDDPRYTPFFTSQVEVDIAAARHDWLGMFRAIARGQLESYQTSPLFVTLIAGLAWTLVLVHLGEVRSAFSSTGALCVAGFFAGVVSTTPTLFLVVVENDVFGFSGEGDLYRIFAYNIGGVGAREELCKLLLFLPLLPFLLKKDDDLTACVVAAFVGLGFAIEENINYFAYSEAASAPGRFLTANFFHVALTGLNGLALFRACRDGRRGLYEFLTVFPLSILAHGSYDALLDLEDVDNSGYMAMIAYVAWAYYFFREIGALKNHPRRTLSLTGSFVFGMSILGGTVIAYQMATLGAQAGATLIFSEILGSAGMLFLFFHVFHEPLAE